MKIDLGILVVIMSIWSQVIGHTQRLRNLKLHENTITILEKYVYSDQQNSSKQLVNAKVTYQLKAYHLNHQFDLYEMDNKIRIYLMMATREQITPLNQALNSNLKIL